MALAFFACVAPTLRSLEFSNSMEVLNVGTVLEIHRGGPWLLPTLQGKPRIEKPPLTAWITALATRRATTAALDDPNPVNRTAAYKRLAFDVRWTALLTGALTLLATYALATIVARGDGRIGLIAAIACASNYFFLRFTRFATTDVQLMLWVTVTNVLVARCVLDRVSWTSALGAGAALGLAFMAKGPVALVQTLLPAAVYLLLARAWDRRSSAIAPMIVGTVVMIAIASWWFIVVALRVPGVVATWLSETNPAGGDRLSSSNPFVYGIILAFLLPWSVFFVHGLVIAIAHLVRKHDVRLAYPTVVLLTTILVMSCFADRKDRYLLPMVPIASVVAAQSAILTLRRAKDALPDWAHWVTLLLLGLIPLAGLTKAVKTIEGQPWFTLTFAVSATTVAVLIVVMGMLAARRTRWMMFVATFALMMFLQAIGVYGYAKSREGHSEMRPLAEFIRQHHPTAQVYNYRGDREEKRAPVDLSIYLNRPTPLVVDPGTLPRTDRPQIYVMVQGRRDPEPQPAPGWTFLHKVRRDKDWYWAFVRE